MTAPFAIGRMIFGGFFVYSGINHFRNTEAMAQYSRSKNVPSAEAAVTASGALLVAAGASLMLGVKPRLGAAGIVTFLAGVTPVMHDFWRAPEPGQRMNDMVHFGKNLALLGSALSFLGSDAAERKLLA